MFWDSLRNLRMHSIFHRASCAVDKHGVYKHKIVMGHNNSDYSIVIKLEKSTLCNDFLKWFNVLKST